MVGWPTFHHSASRQTIGNQNTWHHDLPQHAIELRQEKSPGKIESDNLNGKTGARLPRWIKRLSRWTSSS
jgi:hypothetical protein